MRHVLRIFIILICIGLVLSALVIFTNVEKNFHYTNEKFLFSVDYRAPLATIFSPTISKTTELSPGVVERVEFPLFAIDIVADKEAYEKVFPSSLITIGGGCGKIADLEKHTTYLCIGSGLADVAESVRVQRIAK
ncbi:hypothetical protein HY622_03080 [Candidatus Uhrbacteria bacterium]|nr:hypothetical protein [Candidatus Uhrbacteria bacterium]